MATNESDSVFEVKDSELNFETTQTEPVNGDALLETLVGEGKKYKTQADLAQAIYFKDAHIKKIEEENRTLRQSTTETKTVEQILEALKSTNDPNKSVHDNVRDSQNVDANKAAPISVEEISRKVMEALEAKTETKIQEENIKKVKDVLLGTWGAGYTTVLEQKAKETGLSKEIIDLMAKKSPQALLKMLDLTDRVPSNPTPNPTSRITEATSGQSGEKTFSYYSKLRKADPKLYESKAIQLEIIKQAEKLGPAFYK